MEKPINQPQIDLKSTEGMKNAEGKSIFKSGVILRRISKFVAGTDNDAIMPIPIFYDPSTNKILGENKDKVTQYKAGKEKLFGFFVGQTMKVSGGTANPQLVNDILKNKLR